MKIAIIGSRGIPARYGGFETFAEELAPRLVALGHEVTVYCRRGYTGDLPEFRGVRLIHTPYLRARSLETLSHEATSILDSLRRPFDVYYFLGTRSSPLYLLARLTGRRIVVHTDGIEWKRRKWGPLGRAWLRATEAIAARWAADELVTDARAMRDYYLERYGRASACIPYGAPILDRGTPPDLSPWGLEQEGYHLVVCRLEPENNVDAIIQGYLTGDDPRRLVVVGDTGTPEGTRLAGYASDRVRFLGSVYGEDLRTLRLGAATYVHGHEVGGLNPSLLEAMGAGNCCLALDTPFNREALGDTGLFWRDAHNLARLLSQVRTDPQTAGDLGARAAERVATCFDWDRVAADNAAVLRG